MTIYQNPLIHIPSPAVYSARKGAELNSSILVAEPVIVSEDLAAASVHGSYQFVRKSLIACSDQSLTSERSPEEEKVRRHVPAAASVL